MRILGFLKSTLAVAFAFNAMASGATADDLVTTPFVADEQQEQSQCVRFNQAVAEQVQRDELHPFDLINGIIAANLPEAAIFKLRFDGQQNFLMTYLDFKLGVLPSSFLVSEGEVPGSINHTQEICTGGYSLPIKINWPEAVTEDDDPFCSNKIYIETNVTGDLINPMNFINSNGAIRLSHENASESPSEGFSQMHLSFEYEVAPLGSPYTCNAKVNVPMRVDIKAFQFDPKLKLEEVSGQAEPRTPLLRPQPQPPPSIFPEHERPEPYRRHL